MRPIPPRCDPVSIWDSRGFNKSIMGPGGRSINLRRVSVPLLIVNFLDCSSGVFVTLGLLGRVHALVGRELLFGIDMCFLSDSEITRKFGESSVPFGKW